MELNLTQELASMDQDPLFLLFLDLRKAYDTVNRYRLLITLEGSRAGPRMCGVLETFCDCQKVVPRQNGFYGPAFPATRGTIQGKLVSLTLFNVVVYNVIRTWIDMTLEDQRVAHDGLGETVGQCLGVFYSDYGMIGSRDLDLLQHAMNVLVGLFKGYGLKANAAKSRTMTFQPGAIRVGMLKEVMVMKCVGVGDLYRVRLQRRIPCTECGVDISAGYMTSHCRRMHVTDPEIE